MNDTQTETGGQIHERSAHKATDMHEIEHLAASLAGACSCEYEGCRKFLAQRTARLAALLGIPAGTDAKTEWTWQRTDGQGLVVRGFPMSEAAIRKHVADLSAREDFAKRGWRYEVARRVVGPWVAEAASPAVLPTETAGSTS